MKSISFIGAGNVATRLAVAFHEKGQQIQFVWNRNAEKSTILAEKVSAASAVSLAQLLKSEVIVIAVSDDAIQDIVQQLSDAACGNENANLPVCVHTSGATPLSVLTPLSKKGFRCGVLYPMITMSKERDIDFAGAPLLLEADSESTSAALHEICSSIGTDITLCDSGQRLRMHAAAVFSCNFTDYILGLAFDIAGESSGMLMATTIEMMQKAFNSTPEKAMTGPAKRGDYSTIEKHIRLLESLGLDEHKEIYKAITDKILIKYSNQSQ